MIAGLQHAYYSTNTRRCVPLDESRPSFWWGASSALPSPASMPRRAAAKTKARTKVAAVVAAAVVRQRHRPSLPAPHPLHPSTLNVSNLFFAPPLFYRILKQPYTNQPSNCSPQEEGIMPHTRRAGRRHCPKRCPTIRH